MESPEYIPTHSLFESLKCATLPTSTMSYTPYTPPASSTPQPPTSNQYPYGTYFVPGPYATQAGAYAATYPPGTPYPTTGLSFRLGSVLGVNLYHRYDCVRDWNSSVWSKRISGWCDWVWVAVSIWISYSPATSETNRDTDAYSYAYSWANSNAGKWEWKKCYYLFDACDGSPFERDDDDDASYYVYFNIGFCAHRDGGVC